MFSIGEENQLIYTIVMLCGGVLALALGWRRAAKAGVPHGRAALLTALMPLMTLFFAHLLYCLVDAENVLYSESLGFFFAFWKSGRMFYGGLLGALLALLLAGGPHRSALLGAYAPSMALFAAVARIGEGLLGEGYGEYWTGEGTALCRFPFMMYDAYDEEWAWALFAAEALVALVLFVVLLCQKKPWKADGMLLFFGLYASAQVVLESLRRDEFLRWGFVRVEELASAVAVLVVLVCYCAQSGGAKKAAKALCFAAFGLLVTLCILLEFATEGRIPFLLFLDVNACYVAMAAACAGMAACVLWMRRLGAQQGTTHGRSQTV